MNQQIPQDRLAHLIATNLSIDVFRARETMSRPQHGGWFRPPCMHMLQVVDGEFEIKHPGISKTKLKRGEAILVGPGTRYYVCVKKPREAPIRYAHFSISVFGSLALPTIADVPVLLSAADGVPFGDAVAATEQAQLQLSLEDPASMSAYNVSRTNVLHHVMRVSHIHEQGKRILGGAYDLQPVLKFMRDHMHMPITRQELAEKAGLSPSRFSAVFTQCFSQSPMHFLRQLRLEEARKLLALSSASIQEIAGRFCFSDAFHFSKSFKQAFGLSPRAFRKECPRL